MTSAHHTLRVPTKGPGLVEITREVARALNKRRIIVPMPPAAPVNRMRRDLSSVIGRILRQEYDSDRASA